MEHALSSLKSTPQEGENRFGTLGKLAGKL